MKPEPIVVRETHSAISLLLYVILAPAVAVGCMVAALRVLAWLQPVNPHVAMLVLVGIGVAPTALAAWSLSFGRRARATPVLHIDASMSTARMDAARVNTRKPPGSARSAPGRARRVLKAALASVAPERPCVKFTVCEEGIVMYRSGNAGLVRWGRIKEVRADDDGKRFEFTVRKTLGKDSFSAPDRFDEVKQMLSEHVPVN
jgi:hypothetical protein